jgi:hypothetical protein
MAIARLPDWRTRLSALIEERRRTPAADCGLFVADAVLAMTGVDLVKTYRGRYGSVAQGVALLAADGYADVCDFIGRHFAEIHPSRARAGDIMAFPSDGTGWALGIVNGERVTVLRGSGLGTVSRDLAARAFEVA